MTATATATKTFAVKALDDEIGRRRKNKKRAKGSKVRAASFVFPNMSADDIAAVKAGEIVEVNFKTGRVEHVGLK